MKGGQISGRYNWNQNWGVELGFPFNDVSSFVGTLFHVTYQMKPSSAPELALQFGLGGAGSAGDMATDGLTVKTDVSLYGNAAYAFSENVTGTLSLWYLKQKINYDPIFGWPNDDLSLVHWSAGVGYKF